MKKTMKKWTSFLVAMALVLAMLTTAMADTIYTSDGFTIPSERIAGFRIPVDASLNEGTDEVIPPEPGDDELPETGNDIGETPITDEALDEQQVEGLVIVDADIIEEPQNDGKQTEVQMVETDVIEIADDEKTLELDEVILHEEADTIDSEDNKSEDIPADNKDDNQESNINEDELAEQGITELDSSDEQVVAEENINEEIIEEPIKVTYDRDEEGNLILDGKGNPIPQVPEGLDIPVKYLKDAEGKLILDEFGEPIPTETVAAGSQVMMSLEDQLDPNRTMDVYVTYEGKGMINFGSYIDMTVIMNGYDNLIYTLQWKYSKDGVVWNDCVGEKQTTMRVQLSPDNVLNWWTVEAEITGVVEE